MNKWVKRGIIFVVIAAVMGVSVYQYLMNRVSKEIESQLSEYEKMIGNDSALAQLDQIKMEDEKVDDRNSGTVQSGVEKKAVSVGERKAAPKSGSAPVKQQTTPTNKVSFSSRQAAIRYGLSKFSVSEINHFRGLASDGLTPAEKAEIKRTIFSRFSQAEINAIRKALSN